jgi:S1-C subfamily serine protease
LSRLVGPAAVIASLVVGASAWLSGAAHGASQRTSETGVAIVDTQQGYAGTTGAGTGIVLTSSGRVLTNNHVIRGATSIRVRVAGRAYTANVLGYSVSKDVALLQLAGAHGLATATLGSSADLRVGAAVTAVGNAGGSGSLTTVNGRLTGLHRSITVHDDQGSTARLTNLIATSAPLVPGDSGGPLLLGGRVIGMDAAGSGANPFRQTRGGFAIPIDTTIRIAGQISSGRRSSTVHVGPTAFLGVALRPFDDEQVVAGAAVTAVVSGSPADRAGVGVGDVITRIGSQTVTSRTSVQNVMLRVAPGRPLRLVWSDSFGDLHIATVRPVSGPPQ